MSGSGAEGLRAVAFGRADGSVWGAVLQVGEATGRFLLGGTDTDTDPPPGRSVAIDESATATWRLQGPDVDLTVVGVEPPAPAPAGDEAEQAPGTAYVAGEGPERCRVSGTVAGASLDAEAVRVILPGPRSSRDAYGSARLVAGWFGDGAALGVLAARPDRLDRSDEDVVRASVFDPERWLAVADPRVSTTYDAEGTPMRVNLELWIGEGDHEYPRRAAGEASAPGVSAAADGNDRSALAVVPMRCHSRGEEGAGVYALATWRP